MLCYYLLFLLCIISLYIPLLLHNFLSVLLLAFTMLQLNGVSVFMCFFALFGFVLVHSPFFLTFACRSCYCTFIYYSYHCYCAVVIVIVAFLSFIVAADATYPAVIPFVFISSFDVFSANHVL